MPWTDKGWSEPYQDDPAWAGAVRSTWGGGLGDTLVRRRRAREGGPPPAGRDAPIHRPHYSDERFARGREHTLYGATKQGVTYEYSDRLWQWDYARAQRSSEWATKEHPWVRQNSPAWWEIYLSAYFDRPRLSLRHIIGGVNVSNGYEYYVFGFVPDWREG